MREQLLQRLETLNKRPNKHLFLAISSDIVKKKKFTETFSNSSISEDKFFTFRDFPTANSVHKFLKTQEGLC